MKVKRRIRKETRLEMVSLMDVMFLLLAFFVLSTLSMVVQRGVSVDLPEAETALVNKKDYAEITITKKGCIFWGKKQVSKRDLGNILEFERKRNPHIRIFINADKHALHEWVIGVLDTVRKSGITKVSFETEPVECTNGEMN